MANYRGMRLQFSEENRDDEHWHSEIEVIYIVSGSVRLDISGTEYILNQEDVAVINSSQMHSLASGDDTLACTVYYPWPMVTEMVGDSMSYFSCNSTIDRKRRYQDLRGLFRELIYSWTKGNSRNTLNVDSIMLKLLDCLIENYLVRPRHRALDKVGDTEKLQQIFQYINQNYRNDVSLSQIAKEMYVSPSTLSRFFRKHTGHGFPEYLNQVRIRSAYSDLTQSDENITKIAIDNGFSNLSAFNRQFREQYGLTPTSFRKQYRQTAEQTTAEQQKQILAKLRSSTLFAAGMDPDKSMNHSVRVELSDGGRQYTKVWNQAINVGSMSQLTQAHLQNQTVYLCQQLGYQYVKIWNVFSSKILLTDGISLHGYNFEIVDDVLDFLVENHLRPWLDFGRRPNTINRNEFGVVKQEEEYIHFRSRRAWENMVREFIRHVILRYGRQTVSSWIFELGFILSYSDRDWCYEDPEGYDFFEAYRFFHDTLRHYLPEARVAGFSVIPNWRTEDTLAIMRRCTEEKCQPDIFTMLLFPYENLHGQDSPVPQRSNEPDMEKTLILTARELMRQAGWDRAKLAVSEWNCFLSNRNFLNDSSYRGARSAAVLSQIWDLVDIVVPFFGSDWVGSHFDTYRVCNGDCGLLTPSNIRKPVFFVLRFMNMLGDHVIRTGENYIITRTRPGSYYVLLFNPKRFSSAYFTKEEDEFEPEQLPTLFQDSIPIGLQITLGGLQDGAHYIIKTRTMGPSEGAILYEWGRFRYDEELNANDVRYLREASYPHMSMEKQTVHNQSITVKSVVQANETVLLHIYTNE